MTTTLTPTASAKLLGISEEYYSEEYSQLVRERDRAWEQWMEMADKAIDAAPQCKLLYAEADKLHLLYLRAEQRLEEMKEAIERRFAA